MKPEEIKDKIIKLLSSTERKSIDKVIKYLEAATSLKPLLPPDTMATIKVD